MNNVVLLRGDGIGPEISEAVVEIFAAANAPINWIDEEAGISCADRFPNGLPEKTLDSIREHKLALKGPTTTPVGSGHKSVNVTLRKTLELYANVRPARTLPGVSSRYEDIDVLIVRENIEDTYGGIEHMQTADVAQCLRLITRPGSLRIARYAFEAARKLGRKKVQAVHKANIMKITDGLFLECFREVGKDYPDIEQGDIIVDNCCMQLVTKPEQFDVLVLPNLFGDIVSDLSAGLVGGLGVAPGGNIGDDLAIFEAVHGSAPDIAGKGIANPTALLLSGIQMLQHLGLLKTADLIREAMEHTLSAGIKTGDLGGSATTKEYTKGIVDYIKEQGTPNETDIAPLRITTQEVETARDIASDCLGVDMFIDYTKGVPPMPEKVGSLELKMMSNRGTKMYPGPLPPEILLVDHYRCRYRAYDNEGNEIVATEEDIRELINAINDAGLTWMHIEKLRSFDGTIGYSKAQGE